MGNKILSNTLTSFFSVAHDRHGFTDLAYTEAPDKARQNSVSFTYFKEKYQESTFISAGLNGANKLRNPCG